MTDKQSLLSFVRSSLIICVTHLYMLICSAVYMKLEGFDVNKQKFNQVAEFLIHNKIDKAADPTNYLTKYKTALTDQTYWKTRHSFNNFPETYMFVLASHTTLGNRKIFVQTWEAQLFYIFTVPIGVLMYYCMIHTISIKLVGCIQSSVMLIFRFEDKKWPDKQRDLFEKTKVMIAAFALTIIFIFSLSLVSIVDSNRYLTEMYYIIDIILTVSSNENFIKLYDTHLITNGLLSTLVYFACLFVTYIMMYTMINLLTNHSWMYILSIIRSDNAYSELSTNGETETDTGRKRSSVWDDYDSVSIPRNGKEYELEKKDTNTSSISSADFIKKQKKSASVTSNKDDEPRYTSAPSVIRDDVFRP